MVENTVDPPVVKDTTSQAVAEDEFERWAKAWEIDTEVESMTDEDRSYFGGLKRKLVVAIRRGRLTVDTSGENLTYALKFPKIEGISSLALGVPCGSAYIGWDRFKDRESMHKLNSFMGEMCGTNPAVFSKMDGRDLKIIQTVAQLFLTS